MSKTHESCNQLNKNILVITKYIRLYSVIFNIRMDHDRLQLFISFQQAGYEVISGEHTYSQSCTSLWISRNNENNSILIPIL